MQTGGGYSSYTAGQGQNATGQDYSEIPIHTGYYKRGDAARGLGSARSQFDQNGLEDASITGGGIGLPGGPIPGMDDEAFEKLYESLSLEEKIEHNDWRVCFGCHLRSEAEHMMSLWNSLNLSL